MIGELRRTKIILGSLNQDLMRKGSGNLIRGGVMETPGASVTDGRFSIYGEPLAKCVILKCKIWVNSRWKIRENWVPVCTLDHRVKYIQLISGTSRFVMSDGPSLMELLGRS